MTQILHRTRFHEAHVEDREVFIIDWGEGRRNRYSVEIAGDRVVAETGKLEDACRIADAYEKDPT